MSVTTTVSCLLVGGLLSWANARAQVLPAEAPITLSDAQPEARVRIPRLPGGKTPQVLELEIQRIDNPASLAFSVAVYLEAPGTRAPEQILVGTVGVYPANEPGRYAMPVSTAWEQLLKTRSYPAVEPVVLLTLKRLHADKPWTPLQVRIAPFRWN